MNIYNLAEESLCSADSMCGETKENHTYFLQFPLAPTTADTNTFILFCSIKKGNGCLPC